MSDELIPEVAEEAEQRLAVIVFSDIYGYSRLMDADEAITLRLLDKHNQRMAAILQKHRGKLIKTVGDAILSIFDSCTQAVRAAIAMHESLTESPIQEGRLGPLRIRIGIHLGETVFRENDVFGHGVNVASRLQNQAQPGEICLSQVVADQVRGFAGHLMEPLGPLNLKNISGTLTAFRIRPDNPTLPFEKESPQAYPTTAMVMPRQDVPDSDPRSLARPASPRTVLTAALTPLRDDIIEQLENQYAAGNLEVQEFEERLELTLAAKNEGELHHLVSDLPPVERLVDTPDTLELVEWTQRETPKQMLAIFGGVERRGGWHPPRFMQLKAIFGGAQLDFREARLLPGVTELEIRAVFGGAEIIVPEDINVEVDGHGIFGGFANSVHKPTQPGVPTLRITGKAIFGGVEVKTLTANTRIRRMLLNWAERVVDQLGDDGNSTRRLHHRHGRGSRRNLRDRE